MTTVELLTLVIAAAPVPVMAGMYLSMVRRHDKTIDAIDGRLGTLESKVDRLINVGAVPGAEVGRRGGT